jgi:hypothetical protein
MGLSVQFARQQSWAAHVRFGSKADMHVRVVSALPPKADIAERECHVRFVPKADMRVDSDIGEKNSGTCCLEITN